MKTTRARASLSTVLFITVLAVVSCEKRLSPSSEPVPVPKRTFVPEPTLPAVEQEMVDVGGQLVGIQHSPFDTGSAQDLFDGDLMSFARTADATTAVVELTFPLARRMSGVTLKIASMDAGLKAIAHVAEEREPLTFEGVFRHQPPDPTLALSFGKTLDVVSLRLELRNLQGGDGHIHIWEIQFQP